MLGEKLFKSENKHIMVDLMLLLDDIKIENFSWKTRFFMALGSIRAGVTGNSIFLGACFYTG